MPKFAFYKEAVTLGGFRSSILVRLLLSPPLSCQCQIRFTKHCPLSIVLSLLSPTPHPQSYSPNTHTLGYLVRVDPTSNPPHVYPNTKHTARQHPKTTRMSTKNSYLLKKSWLQRRGGIMKKGDEIREKFNARVAVFIEKDGVLYAYQSHADFPAQLSGSVRPTNLMTPDHFMTVAQQRRDESPLSQGSVDCDAVSLASEASEPRSQASGFVRPMQKPMARDYFNFSAMDNFFERDRVP